MKNETVTAARVVFCGGFICLYSRFHTIWIRGFDAGALQKALDLPANMIPAMMLPLGYPSANSAPSPMHFKRKPMEAFVTEL